MIAPSLMRRRVILSAAAAVGFLLLGVCWALSSPIGSSPDDDFHLSSAWCAWGDRTDACSVSTESGKLTVEVPAKIVASSACYAFHAEIGAACSKNIGNDKAQTTHVNEREYPWGFYRFAGMFVGPDVSKSVLVIRCANVVLGALLLFAVLVAAPLRMRRAGLLGLLVTLTPLGIFLIASTNPSGWAYMGALFTAGFLASWFALKGVEKAWVRVIIGVGLFISIVIGVTSRTDSAILIGFEVVAISLALGPTIREFRTRASDSILKISPVVIAVILVFIAFRTSSQAEIAAGGVVVGHPDARADELFVSNVLNLPSLLSGTLGSWNLGWLDTPLPAIVEFLGVMMFGGALTIGASALWARKVIAILVIAIPLIALPLLVLSRGSNFVGENVQARYLLPALGAMAVVALLSRKSNELLRLSIGMWVVFGMGLFTTSLVSLLSNVARYASDGSSVPREVLRILGRLETPPTTWSYLPTVSTTWLVVFGAVSAILFVCATLMSIADAEFTRERTMTTPTT